MLFSFSNHVSIIKFNNIPLIDFFPCGIQQPRELPDGGRNNSISYDTSTNITFFNNKFIIIKSME